MAVWDSQHLLSFGTIAVGLRLLFIILLYDLKHYELHLTASLLLLLLSLVGQWVLGYDLGIAFLGMGIFFSVFLLIYYGAKGYVSWRFKQKAEGFGFGDVLLAGILGSMFPVFIQLSSVLEWGYLVCGYLTVSCLIGILWYGITWGIGKWFPAYAQTKQRETAQSSIDIAATRQVLPFLPAMSIAFVLFARYGQQVLSFLVHF
jgi:hypothetical protein